IKKNESLAAFCWKHLTENPNNHSFESHFRHAYLLYDDFGRYQAIAEKRHPKPCLIEEGLFQKSFLVHDDKQMMADILDEYLSVLPLPQAVISLDTENIELIIKRIKERKKTIPSHRNKDNEALVKETEKWQLLIRLLLEKLEEKKVWVYKIDGSKPLSEKVTLVDSTLNSLSS